MARRISTLFIAALLATAAMRAEDQRCSSAAADCDRQIRQMLGGRRFLGMTVGEQNPGLTVKSVVTGSPAARAGLRQGDRLIAVNGKSLVRASAREFKQTLADARETGRIFMIIWRNGGYHKVETRLEPYSKEQIDKIVAAHMLQSHTATAGAQ